MTGSAVIVDAVRTPLGARNGAISGWHPCDLGAEVLAALARRSELDPGLVGEVIVGCATPMGEQGLNLARNAVLAAGWPESVPATTLDRQGAGSLQAIALAAAAVVGGSLDVVVAGGIEVTTTTPPGAWVTPGSRPFGQRLLERYATAGGLVPPGVAAERLAERYRLSRRDLDRHAAESQRRATAARRLRQFTGEIVTIESRGWDRERRQVVEAGTTASADECIREEVTEGDLAACKSSFEVGGRITAGNSAPAADGAAAVLLMTERRAVELDLEPLARVVATAGAAVDPLTMLTGVIPATASVLRRSGLVASDLSRIEVDEWFAAIPLAWLAEHGADPASVNPDGGAIALGHPAGAAGARALTTLVHGLARGEGGYGMVTIGGIGGVATAVVVEAAVPARRSVNHRSP
ncbi:MAG: thiolase family protein [Actinobacteria bacterium]|nr:thiolase family protein [Actinomycetota bacterium]MBW3642315.1 thiolase family protein [Actinomycetota bacterium]